MTTVQVTDINHYLDPDLASILEEPEVDARDLLLHVLAATIEAPQWPGILKWLPRAVFHRIRVWLPPPQAMMHTVH